MCKRTNYNNEKLGQRKNNKLAYPIVMRSDRRSRHETLFSGELIAYLLVRAVRTVCRLVDDWRLIPFDNSCIAVYLFCIHFIFIIFNAPH